ncbi:MAG: hypothetical protein IKR73_01890 [Oscillospiraceae bacterium]|nr:hypothetical protein [Oscillospiraceae bacterium]
MEELKKACSDALRGKITADRFYKILEEISQSDDCSDDVACIIEDAMMEMDMANGVSRTALKECAMMIEEGLQNI